MARKAERQGGSLRGGLRRPHADPWLALLAAGVGDLVPGGLNPLKSMKVLFSVFPSNWPCEQLATPTRSALVLLSCFALSTLLKASGFFSLFFLHCLTGGSSAPLRTLPPPPGVPVTMSWS